MKMSIEVRDNWLKAIDSAYREGALTYDDAEAAKLELQKEFYSGFEVGDGATYHLWTDAHACTVIARTKKTITLQRDKATLDENFAPEFSDDGFYCYNGAKQSYTYERDTNGEIIKARWSEKHGAFRYLGKTVTAGRREYYDYNF